jgi:hypothetical protein
MKTQLSKNQKVLDKGIGCWYPVVLSERKCIHWATYYYFCALNAETEISRTMYSKCFVNKLNELNKRFPGTSS